MNNLAQLEMTLDEARETDRLIKRHINTTRYLLLDMRDRKGWKALGYESFKEYGERELGYQENYIHKLVNAAEISLQIGFDRDCTMVQPAERQLRPLTQVPEESRKEIWEEATRKAEEENAKLTAKRVEEAVEDIIEIGRELTEVKAGLPHGQFLPWIAAEFEMSDRTANDFMNVANRFGGKSAIIADFKPTILYALSAPSTPEPVIEKANFAPAIPASRLCARLGADIPYHQRRWRCVIHTARFSQPSLFWFGLPVDYQPPTP